MSDPHVKENVHAFNTDASHNEGYLYTTNAPFSAIVANKRMSDAIIAAIPPESQRILDLGCGDGVYTAEIAHAFPSAHVVGNDPAQIAITAAQRRFAHAHFAVGNVLDMTTQPDTHFDVSVLRGVIHHLPHNTQMRAIANARSLSKRLVICEPNGNNPILKYIETHSAYHIAHQEQSFTSDTLIAWCRHAGWQTVTVHYIGFVPFFFPELPARLIHFCQPLLERIPFVNKYLSAQIVLICE